MTDQITLPREVVQFVLQVLEKGVTFKPGWAPECEDATATLHNYLAAPRPEPVRHPGYVIGSHWLETAYSRICAGEAEADVLRDCGWERVTDAEALRRDAERLREENEEMEVLFKALQEAFVRAKEAALRREDEK